MNNCADTFWLFAAAMEKRENPTIYCVHSVSTLNLRQMIHLTVLMFVVDVRAVAVV